MDSQTYVFKEEFSLKFQTWMWNSPLDVWCGHIISTSKSTYARKQTWKLPNMLCPPFFLWQLMATPFFQVPNQISLIEQNSQFCNCFYTWCPIIQKMLLFIPWKYIHSPVKYLHLHYNQSHCNFGLLNFHHYWATLYPPLLSVVFVCLFICFMHYSLNRFVEKLVKCKWKRRGPLRFIFNGIDACFLHYIIFQYLWQFFLIFL